MSKFVLVIAGLVLVAGAILVYVAYFQGALPALKPPPADIAEILPPAEGPGPAQNMTGMPLQLPPGFSISIFAKNLPGARVMRFDLLGNMWVSRTKEDKISLLEIKGGAAQRQEADFFKNLAKPHGLAFDPEHPTVLYIAEENKISKVSLYTEGTLQKIIDLPRGGNHFTRTIGFGPDGKLYVSIGSTCNVCNESDSRRAKIFSLNKDGTEFKEFARGLRNAVFFTWHPVNKKMWATEMGRDFLGDDLPPDEINIVEEGKNYGWPICYGKNIHDTVFDKNTYIRNPCTEPFETPSHVDIPAHSAPLGLAFIPSNSGWPEEYEGDLLIAYHGSWNRTKPTGYKIVRAKLDKNGNFEGLEDFITGWLRDDGALGRPVDLVFGPDGVLYISDDHAGVIYKVTRSTPIRSESKPCKITGCSSQVCSDEDVITTCEYRPEYTCYKSARCERQGDGKCGWTETPELERCLKNASQIELPNIR